MSIIIVVIINIIVIIILIIIIPIAEDFPHKKILVTFSVGLFHWR